MAIRFHASFVFGKQEMTVDVLFVCLGNICRSPMAEAVFQHLVDKADLSREINVDSAGTGSWHVGEKAHVGTRRILADHAISYEGRARQVTQADMNNPATYVIAMDQNNLTDLKRRYGEHSRLYRLLDFATDVDVRDVPDPYYSGDFEHVYRLVEAGCYGLLDEIIKREHLGASKNDDR